MESKTAIIIGDNEQIGDYQAPTPNERMSMYQAGIKWLETKHELKSRSQKTHTAYRTTLGEFDLYLKSHHLELDSDPRQVAQRIQEWVITSKKGKPVSSSTINQRLAILSSFYEYAVKFDACDHNPVKFCERPKRIIEDAAPALDMNLVEKALARIDISTREGLRDRALLTLAVMTGRRLSELTGLQWQHITVQGDTVTVKWEHCKGGKVLFDDLTPNTIYVLWAYLKKEFGNNLETITADAYIFRSHSNRNVNGRMSPAAISQICQNRIGVSKVHALRHTFAVNSELAGASLSEIGDSLGHSNYNITAEYLKDKRKKVYKHLGKLETMFGIDKFVSE